MKPSITIEYCPKCGWLLRAAYMVQEFLTTFLEDIDLVTLKPSEVSGHYSISVSEEPFSTESRMADSLRSKN